MAFFVAIILAIAITYFGGEWINSWLPVWKCKKNFWLTEILYRVMRCVACYFLVLSILQLHWNWEAIMIWLVLFGIAYGVKKLTRYLAYDLTKCPF